MKTLAKIITAPIVVTLLLMLAVGLILMIVGTVLIVPAAYLYNKGKAVKPNDDKLEDIEFDLTTLQGRRYARDKLGTDKYQELVTQRMQN